jgi:hypothetical protein
MDPESQDRLRQGLRALADQPVPPGLADRALVGSVSLRRRRRVLTTLSALGVVGVIGASAAVGLPRSGGSPLVVAPPIGSLPAPLTCQTATNEPVPPSGDRTHLPAVVRILIDLLPPRDDYYVVNALTACVRDGHWVYPGGETVAAVSGPGATSDAVAVAYAHIAIGADRAGGRVKVDIYRGFFDLPTTCADLPPLPTGNEFLFCEDAVGDRPLLAGSRYRDDIGVVAVFPDGRGIMVENSAPSISIDLMRTIATHPDLLALAG